jgi:hypothetical protein
VKVLSGNNLTGVTFMEEVENLRASSLDKHSTWSLLNMKLGFSSGPVDREIQVRPSAVNTAVTYHG